MKYKNKIIKWNLEKYNCNKEFYNKYLSKLFMENAKSHLISTFKDFLFYDDFSEFLLKYYSLKEAISILMHLIIYYEKSSYIFPNYTVINEGKYIYKNIIKKQLLINYLEDLETKKKINNYRYKIDEKKIKIFNNGKIFDGEIYKNILINNENNSNINLLFGIEIKKNRNNFEKPEETNSLNSINKIIKIINESYTRSVGTNTINNISYRNKLKNRQNRNNLSSKGINNITNHTSSYSNSNVTSMLRIDKKIKNFNKNLCIHLDKVNSLNTNNKTKKNLKINKNFFKFKTRQTTNLFLTNFSSSFMKSYMNEKNKQIFFSDTNTNNFSLIKSKNKKLNNKAKKILTPIGKIRKISNINSYKKLTTFPSLEIYPKINLKYKIVKINQKKKNPLSNNFKTITKDMKLNNFAIDNKLYHHPIQRNKINNMGLNYFNLNNSKRSTFNISLNNIISKKMNMYNFKKKSKETNIIKKKYKRISFCNKLFKTENVKNHFDKEKFLTNNISKKNKYK